MIEELRFGPLAFSGFDKDNDIEIEIEDYDDRFVVYLNLVEITKLRDWLTEQIEGIK